MELQKNNDGTIPHVIEIIRRINEGSTQPFLCKCDDGKLYVLKSKPSMPPKNLVAEFVAGCWRVISDFRYQTLKSCLFLKN